MKVQPTTTITLDGQSFEISKLSAEVQQMIAYLDDWRQEEVDLSSKLLMVRGALRDLQNALSETVQKEITDARQKAQDLGLLPQDQAADEAAPQEAANEAD